MALQALSDKWYVPFARGLLAVLFGLLAIFFPGITLASLVLVFGVYALMDGAFEIYHAIADREAHDNWGWRVAEGVISVLAGLAAFILPPLVGLTLLFIVGIYAIFTGLMQLVSAWRLRSVIEREWVLALTGAVSIVFGVLTFIFPLSSAFAIATVIGIYSIVFGFMLMGLALKYRGIDDDASDYTNEHVPSTA